MSSESFLIMTSALNISMSCISSETRLNIYSTVIGMKHKLSSALKP
jgi:hypothetical protein